MLKEVLKEIRDSNVFSKALIGKNLNISESMVEDLTNQLIRMGYLSQDLGSPTCNSKCAGCSISSCKTIPIKIISLTEKGNRILNS